MAGMVTVNGSEAKWKRPRLGWAVVLFVLVGSLFEFGSIYADAVMSPPKHLGNFLSLVSAVFLASAGIVLMRHLMHERVSLIIMGVASGLFIFSKVIAWAGHFPFLEGAPLLGVGGFGYDALEMNTQTIALLMILIGFIRSAYVANKARFPMLNEPDPSYHGVVYTEALGPAAYIGRARVVPLRNMGAAISPFNAFMILQGCETLALRMDRICANTSKIAWFLKDHPKVSWVSYAGLPEHPDNHLVEKYMGGRASGILTFGVKGGRAAGEKFLDALKLVIRLVNIGDAKSLACHPASTTHRQLSPEELASAGVSEAAAGSPPPRGSA